MLTLLWVCLYQPKKQLFVLHREDKEMDGDEDGWRGEQNRAEQSRAEKEEDSCQNLMENPGEKGVNLAKLPETDNTSRRRLR